MSDDLLDAVQHALCCPTGCAALEAGQLADCGAKLTKAHALAAIRIVQEAYRDKIKALLEIKRLALMDADDARGNHIIALKFASYARIASDALQ